MNRTPRGFQRARSRPSATAATVQRSPLFGSGKPSKALRDLCNGTDLLGQFQSDVERAGLVGEQRAAKLVYLTAMSALLPQPTSLVLKGPSSAGKNYIADAALRFIPDRAVKRVTSMSERALFYGDEEIKHRTLYIAEGDGVATTNFLASVVRSLLSEGVLRYDTVDKTSKRGMHGKSFVKEGPAAFLTTTTLPSLDGELETRLLSVPVDDSRQHTRSILLAQAARSNGARPSIEYEPWHALYEDREAGCRDVELPFAPRLAEAIPDAALATHMRRAFKLVLSFISANALLHRDSRQIKHDRIVATDDDYAAVRPLLDDLLAESAEQTVSPDVRATVDAVAKLSRQRSYGKRRSLPTRVESGNPPSITDVAKALGSDKSTASRRIKVAIASGYLRNAEDHDGKPARLYLGSPLPDGEQGVLPDPAALAVPSKRTRRRQP